MSKLALFAVVAFSFMSVIARADGNPPPHCINCQPETKPSCFNVVCYYDDIKSDDHHFHSCKAAATFNAPVTLDGGEVQSDSDNHNNPQLEVSCDGKVLFNNSARRFTDLLGTRIQGESGPRPSVTLPRGELHSGADDHSGDHQSSSTLQFDSDDDSVTAHGTCYIWTGNP